MRTYVIILKGRYIDTYIIGHYKPFSQDYKLVSNTTYVVFVLILSTSGGTYSLKSISNNRFLRNFSWQFYLLSEFLPEIYWEEAVIEFFFHISFSSRYLNYGLKVFARSLLRGSHRWNIFTYSVFILYV